eukprot:m.8933 g.8933  ORF g.8933 m.8933 type:complete len:249 (+) comp3977_c0_seq1:124-870(+)
MATRKRRMVQSVLQSGPESLQIKLPSKAIENESIQDTTKLENSDALSKDATTCVLKSRTAQHSNEVNSSAVEVAIAGTLRRGRPRKVAANEGKVNQRETKIKTTKVAKKRKGETIERNQTKKTRNIEKEPKKTSNAKARLSIEKAGRKAGTSKKPVCNNSDKKKEVTNAIGETTEEDVPMPWSTPATKRARRIARAKQLQEWKERTAKESRMERMRRRQGEPEVSICHVNSEKTKVTFAEHAVILNPT